jgi:hypothetical protein
MTIDKRINFRGGGMDMGNTRSQARSASMGNTRSRSTSSGTGGSSGNLGGGGGGQESNYRQYSPPTKPTYTSANIDQKPVTGADFQRSQNEFINNLNQNNLLRAQQTNTPFVPYQGGARTTEYYNPNPLKGILTLAAGIPMPGLGFLLTQGGRLKDGIMSLNNRIQNSDFGRSKNLMDYLDIRNYGGYDEREMTRRINMDEAKLLQADIDSGMYDGMGVKPVQTFEFDPSNFNTRNVATVNSFGDTTVPGSSYDMAGVNTPFAQQAPEEFVSQFLPETDIYDQQTTRYQTKPEQVETDIFFSPELKSEDNLMTNSDVAPEFQNMIMRASGTIGNYAQNAVSNQLYGKDYAVLDPFEQQQIDTAIETYGTKSTGELASGTEI